LLEGGNRTILLLNLIVELVVTATLAEREFAKNPSIQKEINPSI